jgi:pentatricopeptide repeat protein
MPPPIYSIDTSALIHGWRRVYRPRNFGFVWTAIDGLIREGRLRASIEVYREMERKDDELFDWCKERRADLFVEIDDACQAQVSRIMGRYPRLVDTVKGRSGGDPFVIALAAAGQPPMTVITEESPGRQRIPDVCTAEGILYIGLADLIEQENWQFG